MKYFIDTHDKAKGSFPQQELTEEEFFENFDLSRRRNPRSAFSVTPHT